MGAFKFISFFRIALMLTVIVASALPARAAIIFGTQLQHSSFGADPIFDSIGWIKGTDSSGGSRFAGSFTLVTPEWALTNAHTVDDGWSSLMLSFDRSASNPNGTFHSVAGWFTFPGFVDDNGLGTANDIALIRLAQPVNGITPADIYWGDISVGMHIYTAGYGELAIPGVGVVSPPGDKFGGENIISRIGWPALGIQNQFFMYDFSPLVGGAALPLEQGSTDGDSGSGVFAEIDGKLQLVGLNSFGRGALTQTGAIRPAVYRDWYIETTTSVPEPTSIVLFGSMLPILLARRLRRRAA